MSGRTGLYACMLGGTVLIAGPAIAAEVSGGGANSKLCHADGEPVCGFSAALNDNPHAWAEEEDDSST